jgi:hypothetical protein
VTTVDRLKWFAAIIVSGLTIIVNLLLIKGVDRWDPRQRVPWLILEVKYLHLELPTVITGNVIIWLM